MATPKLTKLELKIMDTLWTNGDSSIREIQELFPEKGRPAYTTIQTTVYRLETKKVVERVKKIGNSHIFRAAVSRSAAQRRLVDELLSLFGGRIQPVMAHLVQSGRLTPEDIAEAQRLLDKHAHDERRGNDDSGRAFASMQGPGAGDRESSLAVDWLSASGGAAWDGAAQEPSAHTLLAVAGGVDQISASPLAAGCIGGPVCIPASTCGGAGWCVLGFGRGQ